MESRLLFLTRQPLERDQLSGCDKGVGVGPPGLVTEMAPALPRGTSHPQTPFCPQSLCVWNHRAGR